MGVLLAWVVGYIVGARSGTRDFDDVIQALKELRESEEAQDLWAVIRAHLAHALRASADALDTAQMPTAELATDLVSRVRSMMDRD